MNIPVDSCHISAELTSSSPLSCARHAASYSGPWRMHLFLPPDWVGRCETWGVHIGVPSDIGKSALLVVSLSWFIQHCLNTRGVAELTSEGLSTRRYIVVLTKYLAGQSKSWLESDLTNVLCLSILDYSIVYFMVIRFTSGQSRVCVCVCGAVCLPAMFMSDLLANTHTHMMHRCSIFVRVTGLSTNCHHRRTQ